MTEHKLLGKGGILDTSGKKLQKYGKITKKCASDFLKDSNKGHMNLKRAKYCFSVFYGKNSVFQIHNKPTISNIYDIRNSVKDNLNSQYFTGNLDKNTRFWSSKLPKKILRASTNFKLLNPKVEHELIMDNYAYDYTKYFKYCFDKKINIHI